MVKLMTRPELKQAAREVIDSEIPKKDQEFKDRINRLATLFFVDDGSNAVLNMINAVKSSINSGFVYELSKHQYFEDLQGVRFWTDLTNKNNRCYDSIEDDVLLMFNYFLHQLFSTNSFYFTGVSCSENNFRVLITMSARDKENPYIIADIYDAYHTYDGHQILNLSDVIIFGKVFGDMIKSIEGENE